MVPQTTLETSDLCLMCLAKVAEKVVSAQFCSFLEQNDPHQGAYPAGRSTDYWQLSAFCVLPFLIFERPQLLGSLYFLQRLYVRGSTLRVSVFGGLRINGSRIGGSRDTQDELYFKHLGKRLNCSYTKNKF